MSTLGSDAPLDEAAARDKLREARQHFMSAPVEALHLADEVLAALEADAPVALRCKALQTRGAALSYLGRYDEGLATLREALDKLPADSPADELDVLRAHSLLYEEMGAIEDALAWAVRAVEVARRIGDPAQLGHALLSVAVALSRSGDAAAGLERYHEVLRLYEACGDHFGAMQVLNNIGIGCKNLGRHEEAVTHIRRAIAMAESQGEEGALAVALSNLGEPLWKLDRLDEARSVMEDAAARLRRNGYPTGETHARVLLGQVLHAAGDDAAAQAELEQALELAQRTGSRNHAARAHRALADLHKAAGRYEQALAHHEAYHAAERAQFNEESARALRSLQVRFDLARARHDAEVERLRAAELTAQSRTDALTGLANRRHLDERLADDFERARRLGHVLAVALIDIDDFKQVNDRFGHATGDEVLRRVGALLKRQCRSIDLVARYGGEEFCILFVEADAEAAARACEAMRAAVAAEAWPAVQAGLMVTVSIGLASLGDAAADKTPAALLRAADHHLYEAKHRGKNQLRRAA